MNCEMSKMLILKGESKTQCILKGSKSLILGSNSHHATNNMEFWQKKVIYTFIFGQLLEQLFLFCTHIAKGLLIYTYLKTLRCKLTSYTHLKSLRCHLTTYTYLIIYTHFYVLSNCLHHLTNLHSFSSFQDDINKQMTLIVVFQFQVH